MKVRALRGVCVGVERHLKAGDTDDLDPAAVQFLISINAVEVVKDEPASVPNAPQVIVPEKKPGKKER